MSDDSIPEPDRIEGAPHPRHSTAIFGHEAAEAEFLDAHASGRLHHAWLLSGPRGIGKATLAWRIARFLAATPAPGQDTGLFGDAPSPASLDLPAEHPVTRRAAALAEPAIYLCRRGWDEKAKRLKTQLTVDEIRRMKSHFALSATDGGRRTAIIDPADEMNTAAANALLKLLEEPPANTVLLLVNHQPARLLPTIRSRCRTLRLGPLSAEDLGRALQAAEQPLDQVDTLHRLSGGSVGEAVGLLEGGGLEIWPAILTLLAQAPRMDRQAIAALAQKAAGRANDATYRMIVTLTERAVARLARAGAGMTADLTEAEAPIAARLSPDPAAARAWAETHATLTERTGHARAVNLDPEQVILDMLLAIERTASRIRPAAA
ncbi:DNA polymerase III subunit delta' [Rhodobacteraceae bacterium 2CG4]|uniref:DNA polymerase III subunit delta n=1 Tax=Halovulum marinum TaxID=2662447 RepID=A0A6L5Z1H0_9RHOB|nr:DNA polymerase III subunit delta' [Halovulum marinum]MSU89844.1 DNA polymerase III subunit delta' [Halovulum marinum]